LLAAALAATPAAARSFDGITILSFDGNHGPGGDAIARGDRIIVFVSSRGAYASVSDSFQGRRSCLAAVVPNSFTGRSISFGVDAPLELRRQRTRTLCPKFTLTFEGPKTVRVSAGQTYSRAQRVLVQVPFVGVDFGAAHFTRSEIRGVRLGPVPDPSEVGALRPNHGEAYKIFRRQVGENGNYGTLVQGKAAAAEITGWPWDVLFNFRFSRKYDQPVASSAFRDAAIEHWGQPSSERPGRLVWIYDLAGKLVRVSDPMTNSCRATVDPWLKVYNGVFSHIDPNAVSGDLGPWGCSVILEVGASTSDAGVGGFNILAWSGYTMALNHFFQRIEE